MLTKTNHTVYLAGPIKGLNYAGAVEWRDGAEAFLDRRGIKSLSPMRHKQHLKDVAILDGSHLDAGHDDILTTDRGIFERDRRDILTCDLVVINLIGAQTVSIGTMFEIAWAHLHRVTVVLAMEPGNIHDHPFVTESCPIRVHSLDAALELVPRILG